jgi:glycosyltransferase involved in cell wall biosynthesis
VTDSTTAAGPQAAPPGRIHLVYPHGERISTPDAIGREVGGRLEKLYEVLYYNWTDQGVIVPRPGDVLLGHPHPDPRSIFRRSLKQRGWRRRLMLAPFHHGDLRQIAFEDSIIPLCDVALAITGPYWIRTLDTSLCSHWQPKLIPLEHAVDRHDFPPVKTTFNEPGKRRVLYVGHSGRGKGTDYLASIAALLPEAQFGWMGGGKPIPGVEALGYQDFSSVAGRDAVSRFDFLMMCGNADSNPTTILEAMAWGLLPICTPTCGYEGIPGITNIPNGDRVEAARIVKQWLFAENSVLVSTQQANWKMVDNYYNWDRVARQVVEAVESGASPALAPETLKRRMTMAFYDITSPYGRVAYGPLGRLWSRLRGG